MTAGQSTRHVSTVSLAPAPLAALLAATLVAGATIGAGITLQLGSNGSIALNEAAAQPVATFDAAGFRAEERAPLIEFDGAKFRAEERAPLIEFDGAKFRAEEREVFVAKPDRRAGK
jgi:hypothetical protein